MTRGEHGCGYTHVSVRYFLLQINIQRSEANADKKQWINSVYRTLFQSYCSARKCVCHGHQFASLVLVVSHILQFYDVLCVTRLPNEYIIQHNCFSAAWCFHSGGMFLSSSNYAHLFGTESWVKPYLAISSEGNCRPWPGPGWVAPLLRVWAGPMSVAIRQNVSCDSGNLHSIHPHPKPCELRVQQMHFPAYCLSFSSWYVLPVTPQLTFWFCLNTFAILIF